MIQRIIAFVMCLPITAGICEAASVTGVLYGETGGQGANPVRAIHLAVGNQVYYLEYSPRFFKPRFRTKACWDVGAIWTVKITGLVNLGTMLDATCTSQIDESAHEPVRLVQQYLDELAKNPTNSLRSIASSRWKSSPEFEKYQGQVKDLVLSTNFGGRAGCLEVVKVERMNRTEVESSDCAIQLRGNFVKLHFNVVRNVDAKRWEIDEIRIE